jgi:hypothetical protein
MVGEGRTVRAGAVVALLEVSVGAERVADAWVLGLSEAVVDGVVEALLLSAPSAHSSG